MSIIVNHTCDGKCSNCGECCSDFLPLYLSDIERIKKYLKTHKVERHNLPNCMVQANLSCPFRNNKEKKCDIYEVRPLICRTFMCNESPEQAFNKDTEELKEMALQEQLAHARPMNMTKLFFNDDTNEKIGKEFFSTLDGLEEREREFLLRTGE